MLDVVKKFKPRWIIGENVFGICGMVQPDAEIAVDEDGLDGQEDGLGGTNILSGIIADLEGSGYEVQTFCIPACAVGAPHRRDRVWIVGRRTDDSDTIGEGLPKCGQNGGQSCRDGSDERAEWKKNWHEVATEFCLLDDGLPAELDGFKLSKAGHRVAQLKGYGNSIVSQVAEQIMRHIKSIEAEGKRRDK